MLRAHLFEVLPFGTKAAIVLACLALVAFQPAAAWAQAAPAAAPAATAPAAASATAAKKGVLAPQEVTLNTRDGVELSATYFPSSRGKEAVPVILVPALNGSQADYKDMAVYLQSQGHAVLTVDLRGQGGSKKMKVADKIIELKLDTMPADQYYNMVRIDMERVKAYLMEKNNAGELNIEMLCVVGAEMGAIVAMEWARMDWSWPILATGKQGQDVRALVLISPVVAIKYFKLGPVLSFPPVMRDLSVLILVGRQDSKAYREAQRLHSTFKKFHPDVPADERAERQSLFYGRLDTSLQGSKLLGAKGLNVEKTIDDFITLRLVNKAKDFPWKPRNKP